MHKRNDLNFSRFGSEISQSADLIDQAFENQSPICILHTPTYTFPSKQLFSIEQEQSEDISIEDDINSFNNFYSLYKCYRCYGVRNLSTLAFSLPLCEQCEGSEFISQANPLVFILERVLKRKLPILYKKQDRCVSPTNYHAVICGGCGKEHPKQQSFSCQNCKSFYLCSKCFQTNNFLHPETHPFVKTCNEYSIKVKEISNMKKISQEYQQNQEICYNEDEAMNCSICSQQFESCYLICLDCQQQDKSFTVCSKCEQSHAYQHTAGHNMAVRTIKMESKLPELFAKPSASSSTCTNFKQPNEEQEQAYSPTINRELTKSSARSMVFFPHLDLDESNQMPEESQGQEIRTSQTEILWSPSYRNNSSENDMQEEMIINPESTGTIASSNNCMDQKEVRSLVFRSGSMVSIKMEESEDNSHDFIHHRYLDQKVDIPLLTPFKFTNSFKGHTEIASRPPQIKQEDEYIFKDYKCDICLIQPIKNVRYHCKECEDYDLCETCYVTRAKQHQHQQFQEIDGRAVRKEREIRFTKLKENTIKQTHGPLRRSTVNSGLFGSRGH